jgi:hypothetical protein
MPCCDLDQCTLVIYNVALLSSRIVHYCSCIKGYSGLCVGAPSIGVFHISSHKQTQGSNEKDDQEEL